VAARTLTCLLAIPLLAVGADIAADVGPLLTKIQSRYNKTQSLKLEFSETYAGTKRPIQSEAGVLYLKKPGKMRWEYTSPAGKLFLSDGKEVLTWTPAERSVEKGKLKESEDVHAPIAFLLGKLDFRKEFKSFETRLEGGDTWIVATPKSDNLAWSKVDFLATPEGQIRRVRIVLQDQSKLDFTFANEQLNVPVAQSMFTFQTPPGAQVTEVGQ
jgi:outer membrane lipoprotein carrier protein